MPLSRPSISIITPVLDRRDTIAAAIESAASQSYGALEHIVIDGGSRDGTLEVLGRYPHLKLTSAKDEGIYDALNRGLAQARGELVVLLNGDDLLAAGALEAVAHRAELDPATDVICGGATLVDMHGSRVADYSAPMYRKDEFATFLLGSPIINARIFRRSAYDRVGRFDTSFALLSDRDFLIRARLAGLKSVEVDRTLYVYRQHLASATFDPKNVNAAKISREFLRLALYWLNHPAAPAELRRACKIRYGRSAITLLRLARERGGGSEALFRTTTGHLSLTPTLYAAMAALAWLRNEPYART